MREDPREEETTDPAHVHDLPLFSSLGRRGRAHVARAADEIDVPEGRELMHEGDAAFEFFVIQDGTARVSVEGQQRAELGPGDFFGEIGLTTGKRSATVTATSPMRLIVMTRQAFRGLEREMPGVAEAVRQAIQERLVADRAASPPAGG